MITAPHTERDAHTTTPSPQSTSQRLLPGGAFVRERWTTPGEITVDLHGDLGAADRNALLDWFTAGIVHGARRIVIHRHDTPTCAAADGSGDRTIRRLQDYMARTGGVLIVHVDDSTNTTQKEDK
jgi:hypothetical protein